MGFFTATKSAERLDATPRRLPVRMRGVEMEISECLKKSSSETLKSEVLKKQRREENDSGKVMKI